MARKAAIWIGAGMLLWYGVLRGVKAVRVAFDNLRLISARGNIMLYQISLLVHNPLLVAVTIDDVQGTIYLMNTHVATINYPVHQKIRAFASSVFNIQFEAYSDKIGEAITSSMLTGDVNTLTLRFEGYVDVKGVKIPITKEWTYEEFMYNASK